MMSIIKTQYEIPHEDEINALSHNQLRSLFWMSYGWMIQQHREEMDKAVSSALDEIRNIEEMINNGTI